MLLGLVTTDAVNAAVVNNDELTGEANSFNTVEFIINSRSAASVDTETTMEGD